MGSRIVVDLQVAVNNIKLLTAAETQQLVVPALPSSCKIVRTASNNTNLLSSSRKASDIVGQL
jgi:hypothetical protein